MPTRNAFDFIERPDKRGYQGMNRGGSGGNKG